VMPIAWHSTPLIDYQIMGRNRASPSDGDLPERGLLKLFPGLISMPINAHCIWAEHFHLKYHIRLERSIDDCI